MVVIVLLNTTHGVWGAKFGANSRGVLYYSTTYREYQAMNKGMNHSFRTTRSKRGDRALLPLLAAFLRRLSLSMEENPVEKKDMIFCGGSCVDVRCLELQHQLAVRESYVAPRTPLFRRSLIRLGEALKMGD